ncbi:hypothetical protein [Hoeflea poritis]|uniref:Transcriptional regulator n=1 Tax=Hoeflea poritis TaxID=2993659 RepID=A0ABT4VSJ9_9HYPH|nr:hypothetical protein [Hoeflea poritis]MDA4847170.1 hypothetical protein [Hoeflea poritis]
MSEDLQTFWKRLSIVEAKIQQEQSRLRVDSVRLALLEQMKSALKDDIRTAESQAVGRDMGAVSTAAVQPAQHVA